MRPFAAAIVVSLAAASSLASTGCKRFRRSPPSYDAGVYSAPTSTASARIVGAKPGNESCEEYVVVGGALDPASVCIKDFGAPLTVEITSAIPAVTTTKTTIDPKELVLDTAQKELTLDAPKVTTPVKRGEWTYALSKRAALAVLERMLDDFATGKSKTNPIPKSSAPLKKGDALTLVFLKRPEHGGKTGESLADLKPGGRIYLRYGNGKVRDFDKVVIAREGKETFKGTCRYLPFGTTPGEAIGTPETFPRVDVPVELTTYDRGADTSKVVKRFAPTGPCPMGVDMKEVRDKGSVRVLAPLDKILDYVRAI